LHARNVKKTKRKVANIRQMFSCPRHTDTRAYNMVSS